ncbi:MAG TPA: YdbL family protein [Candidatus Cybelea sp.]|nr:YdbL family protein [Candidatus Cybelea sp.]
MKISRRALLSAGLAASAFVVVTETESAQSIDDLKARGLVGERPDGYVGVVGGGATADVVNTVQQINNSRRTLYQGIAQKNGSSLSAVEAVAGAKLVKDAPPGSYVMDATGKWVKK